jgi:thiamine transport system permease protein
MAKRAFAIGAIAPLGALGAAGAFGLLITVSLGFLLPHADLSHFPPADVAALRFTLLQAALSAGLSCLLAVRLARALFRRRFWGRMALIKLISAPFILPVLTAVMGLLAIFGRAGPISTALETFGLNQISIYGLFGVVLAHVFLNLPLVTRMLLNGWAGVPSERFRLAQNLSFGPRATFRHIEMPMLRALLPGALATVFLICLTSFAVALILGGGPRASTIELGIYQSLRFDFDLGRAARLALVQTGLCLLAVAVIATVWRPTGFGAGLDRGVAFKAGGAWGDTVIIALAALFFFAPMAAIFAKGLPALFDVPLGFWGAALRSIGIATLAAATAVWAALLLAVARARGAGVWVELAAMLPLGTSSLALGTGMFLALRPVVPPQTLALPLAVLFNAALALPFIYRLLLPNCRNIHTNFARLSQQVGLTPRAEMRLVYLPRLRRTLGFCLGLAAAMAIGDFGVIALFGAQDQATLPILVARLMGSYQMQAAAGVSLWLILIGFAMFWGFDHLGGRDADV